MSAIGTKRTFRKDLLRRRVRGSHEDQKHNCRHAEEGQLTQFKVRVVITS